MDGLCPGWTWCEPLLVIWTGNSGFPLCGGDLELADLGLGWNVGRTECDPAVAVLCGSGAADTAGGHEVHETPAVIVTRDGGVGGQDGVLAVGAVHFGS